MVLIQGRKASDGEPLTVTVDDLGYIVTSVGSTTVTTLATLGTLSASGTTGSAATSALDHVFTATVSGISGSVTIRFEGAITDSAPSDDDFGNIDSANINSTINSNGSFLYYLDNVPLTYVRAKYISGTGTVVFKHRG